MTNEEVKSQLDLFKEFYEVDFIESTSPEKGSNELSESEKSSETILNAIKDGLLKISKENGELFVEQRFRKPFQGIEKIQYKEVDGEAFIKFDTSKGSGVLKIYTLLAYLSGQDIEIFKKMKLTDLKVALALGFIFLSNT